MAKVGIVIPTLNNLIYTQKCIESIERFGLSGEIIFIIVDNGSDQETLAWYSHHKSPFTMIVDGSTENRLVNKSWQVGLETAKANGCEYVAFINNDIEVGSDWIGEMLDIFEKNKDIWCISPNYTRGEKPEDFQKIVREHQKQPKLVLEGVGFFFVVRMSAFEELERLDGIFGFSRDFDGGLWYEDKDFFKRLMKVGHSAVKAKHIMVHHYESKTLVEFKNNGLNKLKENNLRAFNNRWGYNPNEK